MAKVYISEYPTLGSGFGADLNVVKEPADVEQVVAIGGSSAQSAAFGSATRFVRIHTDAICSILFGANPTATANTKRMAAGQTEYFAVEGGHKVAVITNT